MLIAHDFFDIFDLQAKHKAIRSEAQNTIVESEL
ncbi:hypothetical protein N481_19520 [Pseudoalteromonas luteoviolacea S4047-1]|uniref:Uncharacterized protein n=1 Tax=Pseudoalteromonas luteoviolacea S4054 TaxID=1129367 RepID=A0A0F6A8H4_9GAMM|nr:hypothetical protein N479_21565 [Pseudoalteromonas luteoviolacea S4054]KZN71203.1 hypothetical protein N481_19520 [Pseudoalteromonas luteoviolacea S4047-1]